MENNDITKVINNNKTNHKLKWLITGIIIFILIIIFYLIYDRINYKSINFYQVSYCEIDTNYENNIFSIFEKKYFKILRNNSDYTKLTDDLKNSRCLNLSIDPDFTNYDYIVIFDKSDYTGEMNVLDMQYNPNSNVLKIDYKYPKNRGMDLPHYDVLIFKIDKNLKDNFKVKYKYRF